jgi:DNA polymerase III delta prime subunit
MLARDDRHKALLFAGPSGCGKTTLARIVKDELKCSDMDFYEVDASKDRGIAHMKALVGRVPLSPMGGDIKFYLIDECHQITGEAANALLKTLEEPPDHAFFALCTTNPEKLLTTIRTRCMDFEVHYLNRIEMKELVDWVLKCEGEVLSPPVKKKLIAVADGCPRQALVLMDKIIDIVKDDDRISILEKSSIEDPTITELCRLLLSNLHPDKKWDEARGILGKLSEDPETIRRGILGWFYKVMLNERNKATTLLAKAIMIEFSDPTYSTGKPGLGIFTHQACYIGGEDEMA